MIRRVMKRLELALFVSLPLVGVGCSSTDDEEARQLPPVYALPGELSSIDLEYLPYEHLSDGCEYRSSYLGMELLAREIPSFVYVIEDCAYEPRIQGPLGQKWRFHASIALWKDDRPAIVEPLMAPDFMTPAEWVDRLARGPVNLYLADSGNPPSYTRVEGACGLEADLTFAPRSIEQMGSWSLANAMIFCAYMRRHMLDSPLYDPAREERLITRTHELLEIVKSHQRLVLDDPQAEQELAQRPWCPPPIAPK
jgi:hypothetical protein